MLNYDCLYTICAFLEPIEVRNLAVTNKLHFAELCDLHSKHYVKHHFGKWALSDLNVDNPTWHTLHCVLSSQSECCEDKRILYKKSKSAKVCLYFNTDTFDKIKKRKGYFVLRGKDLYYHKTASKHILVNKHTAKELFLYPKQSLKILTVLENTTARKSMLFVYANTKDLKDLSCTTSGITFKTESGKRVTAKPDDYVLSCAKYKDIDYDPLVYKMIAIRYFSQFDTYKYFCCNEVLDNYMSYYL